MRRLRSLRAVLFLLLALLFAVLAVLEAIPKPQTEGYIQATPFRVSSSANAEGGYLYRVEGSLKSQFLTSTSLYGIVVQIMDTNGDVNTLEFAVGNMGPGEVRKFSGELLANAPASKITGVSTSILDGDQPISTPKDGFQIAAGTIAFATLSLLSFVLSITFFLRHLRRHHRSA